ncbi:aldehyde ferredoxin oxidoreductase family protein [Haladaptatus sp. DFWS20]|uniref:aldehyde ferredoxin oxidoreductase family protein n=1 Tax=Haladaptatus sp. DFWS20 TaxID=3403467 RepID=UPI003EBE2C86
MLHARGSLLTIDVGEQTATIEPIDDILQSFIGGRGVGTKLAHKRIPFDADPFGSENSLFFTTGPMQISNMSFTGRMNCTSISPLTDGLLSSNAGGYLSRNFTDTGYSAVEITGSADDLLAIHITDENVEFETVPELHEATIDETGDYFEKTRDLGEDQLVAIGPAGENRVRFAAVMTTSHRAFGRGGLGAVLGSKNVKAVSFAGQSPPEIDISSTQMDVHREAATDDNIMKRQGTTSVTALANEMDAFPTRYFEKQSFEGADKIGGEAVEQKKHTRGTCSNCAFACKLPTKDEKTGLETEGPEYETVMAFGGNAMVDDIVAIMKSNDLCDNFGLDTISAGDVVAAYLKAEDEFGNVELVHELLHKIAYREEEGDLLAEGINRFADELGVKDWTSKGMEFPAHDGRRLNGQGLSFATANRGADHMYAEMYSYEYPLVSKEDAIDPTGVAGKASLLIDAENENAINDSGIICKFSGSYLNRERYENLLDADYEDLLEIGSQIVDLERHFNNQRGFDRTDDTLPYEIEGLDSALDDYYSRRGWKKDGTVPNGVTAIRNT